MNIAAIGIFDNPVNINDWYLLFMAISFLAGLILIGPFRSYYEKGISAMYRFSSPEVDIIYAPYTQLGFLTVSVISCLDLGLALVLSSKDITVQGPSLITVLLSASGFFLALFFLKMILYHSVNSLLYKVQTITIKPIRWNGFFIMAFSAASFVILVMSAIVMFFDLPRILLFVGAFLILLIMETGIIFCIKNALLKNKCSILGFILYLCALEIVPIILMLLILTRIISST